MKIRTLLVSLIGLLLMLPCHSGAGTLNPDGRRIMDLQQSRHQVPQASDHIIMMLIDKKDQKKIREIRQYGHTDANGLRASLVVFTSPNDLRGTTLLTREFEKGSFKQWLYLPGTGALQRIASKAKRTAFMGSDFTYEDMLPDNMDEFIFTRVADESIDGRVCYVVDMLPKDKAAAKSSSYGRRRFWVQQDIYLTLKIAFFDHRERLVKTQTSHDVTQLNETAWYAGKILMDNHVKKHKTLMGIKQKAIDVRIDASLFTEKSIISHKHL